jgi:hypothetical protein
MPSSNNKPSSKIRSSFDAFSKVDELVSKPVLGSDGAASWQSFRNDNSHASNHRRSSNAPKAPLKRADKLGTGFSTWDEEREHEGKIRKDAGHAKTNAGYSIFSNKKDESALEEARSRKRKKNVEARIRPDDKEYFIPSNTFEGWKFDYVFTTRNGPNNTGYWWDGMDSIKKEKGELKNYETETNTKNTTTTTTTTTTNSSSSGTTKAIESNNDVSASKSKKKRKRKKIVGPTFIHDPNNPMEQMQAILQQRNQKLMGITSTSSTSSSDHNLPSGWETAKDPSTGNTYYFHRASGNRSWEKPNANNSSSESSSTKDHEDKGGNKKLQLPVGWKSAVDQASGKTYYHHVNGKTTWTKPE